MASTRRLPLAAWAAAAFAAAAVQACTGSTTLRGAPGDGPVTVLYPTAADDRPQTKGPFLVPLAPEADPSRGNGRLVVVSHGSGGGPWVHADLARALVGAGFVVAFPQHQGDRAGDVSLRGPDSWKLRPAEASRAIDAVARDQAKNLGHETAL